MSVHGGAGLFSSLDTFTAVAVTVAIASAAAAALLGLVTRARAVARTPPSSVKPPPPSPEIDADGRLTFRLFAPAARAVFVAGSWGEAPTALARGPGGLWSVTLGKIPAGLHEYSLFVDGAQVADPGNALVKPQRGAWVSLVEVSRGEAPTLIERGAAPAGVLHLHSYRSEALGRSRRLHVYTPPGYDPACGPELPALYLLHGHGDDDRAWTVQGRAEIMLDNLLAQGRARAMIVVMPDGHSIPYEGARFVDREAYFLVNTDAFERELIEEILPLVERAYRVQSDAAGRAVVGLSMGGQQALTLGLRHPELFTHVGAFSAAAPTPARFDLDPKRFAPLRWLWIGCGRADAFLPRNEAFVAALRARGVPHEWEVMEGGHDWPVWRAAFALVAPTLFTAR